MDMMAYERGVLELYEQGATDAEVCALLQVTAKQFNDTYNKDDTFCAVIDYGRTLSKAWWDRTGRSNLVNKSFNTSLFVAFRKNYHGWTDKTETAVSYEAAMSADELEKEVQDAIRVLAEHSAGNLTQKEVTKALNG